MVYLAEMPPSSLCTLGRFALTVDGRELPAPSIKKVRALLTYLVMNRNADVARERLMEVFWPDVEPERARHSLHTALWSVRRNFRSANLDADSFFTADKSVVRWTADTQLDAERFVTLATADNAKSNRQALELCSRTMPLVRCLCCSTKAPARQISSRPMVTSILPARYSPSAARVGQGASSRARLPAMK